MSQISIANDTEMNSGLVLDCKSITNSNSPFTLTNSSGTGGGFNYAVGCNTSSGVITVNLPTTSGNGMEDGRMYYIFDQGGNATSNNITIDAQSGGTINDSQTYVISSNYNSVTLMCVGSQKWIVV